MNRKEMRPQRPDNPRAHRTVGRSQQHVPHYINISGFGTFEAGKIVKMVLVSLAAIVAVFFMMRGLAIVLLALRQWGWL